VLRDAAASGMNMLRVWGGGIYEDDVFYDLCDSLGVLVWQDFMFACAMYPGDDGFLENVEIEAAQNVKRLRNHPCIALWCGNNESGEGWRNWGWQRRYGYSPEDSLRVWRDYEALFHELLPRVAKEQDGTREYWPSSPKYGRADPRNLTEGDSHYWGVWHDAEPFEIFSERVPRFMSEFGFQSFPSMRTIERFAAPEDRRIDSDVMRSHQKHPRGNELIATYMERSYRPPRDFESFVYLSHLLQAEGIGYAIEAHRRAKPYCMGTLYWQLNDCWPVASWSGIDYYGNQKALQYRVKSVYSDPLISPFVRGGRLEVSVVADGREPAIGAARLSLVRFDGEPIWRREIGFGIDPERSVVCFDAPLEDLLGGNDPRKVVLEVELLDDRVPVSSKFFYFVPPKELALEEPSITVEVERTEHGYDLLLETDTLAKNLYLDLDGTLSDNYFDLLPGEVKRVSFVPREDGADPLRGASFGPSDSNPDLSRKIRIISLYDTYDKAVK
jgi:beta-mannosidase